MTINKEGTGTVSINPNQNDYLYGTNVEITANPSAGWKFNHWSGDLSGSSNPTIINMTEDKIVTVHFSKIPSGGGGSPPGGGTGPIYYDPTADAGGPYYTFIGEEIEVNGTKSHDNDEGGQSISRYDWKFFEEDEWHNDSGPTTTYTYNETGVYNVTLRVFDDESNSDTNKTIVIVTQPNRPPEYLIIEGISKGHKNTSYNFNISAIDLDNGNITYTVEWGDGTNDTSSPLENGTIYTVNHMWTAYGKYTIVVSAVDELNASADGVTYNVLIDIHYVKDIGNLIDNNSDDTYDDFYSNETENITNVDQLDDGRYLIDSDDDDNWDWIYDLENDTLEPYFDEGADKEDNSLWYLLAIILIILTLLAIWFYLRKREKEEEGAAPKAKPSKTKAKKKRASSK